MWFNKEETKEIEKDEFIQIRVRQGKNKRKINRNVKSTETLPVKELKSMMKMLGINDAGCLSKEDLVGAFRKHPSVVSDANDKSAATT